MRFITVLLFLLLAGAVAFAQAPSVFDGGVLNAASFGKGLPVAAGSLVSIFGNNLASKVAQADSIPLSTTLGGVSVKFMSGNTSMSATMLYVQPDDAAHQITSQINAQVPWNLVPDSGSTMVTVVVTRDGVSSTPSQVQIAATSPGIFSSGGRAIAVNAADGTLAWPTGSVPGLVTHPAKVGDAIIIYGDGLGAVDLPVPDGQAGSYDGKLRNTVAKPTVKVAGAVAPLLFSGLAPQFVGVNQVNIIIPDVAASDSASLQFQVGDVMTSADITIAVTK